MRIEKNNEIFKFILNLKKKLDIKFYKKNHTKFYISKNKKKVNPVTNLDKRIEIFIRNEIKKNYPNHNVIGEEGRNINNNSKYTWVIDPIDGTKNFIIGAPTWSNLIGLYKKNNCLFSFANFPQLNKFYIAFKKNNYVFVNKKLKKIKLKNHKKKIQHICINTFGTLKNKKLFKYLEKTENLFRITGLDAYNYCLLSEGYIDIIIEANVKKFDLMPIKLLLKNSGAKIINWNGISNVNYGNIIVSKNIKLINQFQKVLKS